MFLGKRELQMKFTESELIALGWTKTAEGYPTYTPGEQVDVIVFSEGWAGFMVALFTYWDDAPEWTVFSEVGDAYIDLAEIPEWWMAPLPKQDA